MRITRTTNRRSRTTAIVEQDGFHPGSGAGNPAFYDHPVRIAMGYMSDGQNVTLELTVAEAEELVDALSQSIVKVREIAARQS